MDKYERENKNSKKVHPKVLSKEDLTGKRFGRLLVLREVERASNSPRNRKWLCLCDCGKETTVYANKLKSGHTMSCGCIRDEQPLIGILEEARVNGVRVERLKAKIPTSNKTGVKGVSVRVDKEGFVRYLANITVKGKQYYLGIFDTITEAAGARRRAEEKYHKPYIDALKETDPMKTYNMTEIAAILGVSRQAVRGRYMQAMKNDYTTFPKPDGTVGKIPFWNHKTLVDAGIIKQDNPS